MIVTNGTDGGRLRFDSAYIRAVCVSHGLRNIIDRIDEIKESANPHIEILGILLTMVSERTRAVKTVKDMLKEHGLDIKTCEARIRQCEAFKQAELKHISIFDYDPKSNGACDMETFFQEIRPRIEK